MARHELKTLPEYFEQVIAWRKLFEIRLNDRNYQEGDELLLREFDPKKVELDAEGLPDVEKAYTGREILVTVPYILRDQPYVPEGYVCMSIKPHREIRMEEALRQIHRWIHPHTSPLYSGYIDALIDKALMPDFFKIKLPDIPESEKIFFSAGIRSGKSLAAMIERQARAHGQE